ncbi:uncharacterized protein Eint_030420 [Encephalitozoon intestinalis ATCC 50506]|uniref:Mon2/Sec7/BIG1-like dimerisation and cyclophilin-binding domain-containing protein n=1 Tax=Encephalitozoon intestinalis (strain ATCC 50506) TaxID=876142 RepID=E0S651_ENCIT|nr:uncharacterized protein Eint_030420 [Encephalitozoon intestinalis ATCC 50506]ADM11186.1 hypothetical protein Eint_030420 [Encephalitozoon intestinalis ATCC 50506]UTX44853.1 cullin-associated NEDD8-dissociated protein 1 [Encephalitozoon intestinalis]
MYLHRSELEAGIEKLMKTMEDHEVLERCRKSLREMDKIEEENIKDFIRETRDIVDAFVKGLRIKKQVPIFVIDFIYTFLVNDLLISSDIKEIISVISEGNWCEVSKMKILQMSYYIIRYESFKEDLALSLFKSIVRMIDDRSRQVQTTAKPIAMHLVDVVFSRACPVFKEEVQSEEGEPESTAVCPDVLEGNRPGSERLLVRGGFQFSNSINDGITFLKHLLENGNTSKEMNHFMVDAVLLITRKSDLFEYEEFRKIYDSEVMAMLMELIKRRCSSRGNVYKVLARLVERHNCLFEKQILAVFDEMEKSYSLLDDLETEMFLDFFGSLDILLFEGYSSTIRRMFFNILENASFDDEFGNEYVIDTIRNSLNGQLKAQEKTSGKFHSSTKAFFGKFSEILYAKLSDIDNVHPKVECLLEIVLWFYSVSGNKEFLDRFMVLGCKLGFTDVVCRNAIENRKHIQDSWWIVLENGKDHLGKIIESICIFDAEEIFFLIKGIEQPEPSCTWTSKERVDFLLSVFNIIKPVVVEPLNIKIFEMILGGILRESGSEEGYPTKVFCSILMDYVGHLEALTPDVESVIFVLLQKMLGKDLERNGLEILETLSFVLRTMTPESCWDTILQCIECSCIPCLYSSLYPIIRWIIEGCGHLISNEHFGVLIDCLYSMCLSPSSEISLKAIFIFQDIGESLMSRRAFDRSPKGKEEKNRDMNPAWAKYIKVLGEMTNDGRHMVCETAIKYLVMFLEAECEVMNSEELDFAANNGLIPVLEKGREFAKGRDSEAHCTLMLIMDECSRTIGKMNYHEELYGKFLELVADSLCNTDSSEIQNMCIESLKMMTNRISGTRDEGKSICQEGSEHSPEDMGFKAGIGERKSLQPLQRLRDLVLNTYKLIFSSIPVNEGYSTSVCLDMIDSVKGFGFKSSERRSLIPLLRKFVHSDCQTLQEKILNMVGEWPAEDGGLDMQLEAYNDWIEFKDIRLSRMLIERIGRILSKDLEDTRYSEAAMDLVEYSKEKAFWEDVVRAFMKGSENIKTRASFISFINGCRVILKEAPKVKALQCSPETEGCSGLGEEASESMAKAIKKRERIILEFLAFYHEVLSKFAPNTKRLDSHSMQPFDQTTESDVREGYKVIFEMSELGSGLGKESISFKCYEILFHDIELIYSDVVEKIRKVLTEYNEMEMIYNGLYSRVKQREVYTLLEKIWKSGNKKLVDDVKDVLVESLRSKDYRVIDHVRKCLEVILV